MNDSMDLKWKDYKGYRDEVEQLEKNDRSVEECCEGQRSCNARVERFGEQKAPNRILPYSKKLACSLCVDY